MPSFDFSKKYSIYLQKLLFKQRCASGSQLCRKRNVDGGIVYLTDAKSSKSVKVVATASAQSHSPIIYP